ncbi:tyrosine-protein phosphatase [Caldalkalibacillus mannanilyticus]|uniref:tyrosine-protein phosphatase n=1 Tax=Caldalkalibacillus mannanilyticus TaxID=1418 RepID=UPI0004695839|nr:CpsB/CapC family capsule biosynthesis tyrosine phosphatase [Caldalkalibacillus mannanilyticus]
MIDFHCHLLPGLDDGAQSIDESLALAQAAVEDGISRVVVTPHHQNGVFVNEKKKVIEETEKLQQILNEHKIPLQLFSGQEIRVYPEIIEDLKNDRLLSVDRNNKYILLELPSNEIPAYMDRIIYEILLLGIIPIIPHPERNTMIRKNPRLFYKMIEKGALSQLTAASVAGEFGREVQKFSYLCLEHQLSHFIASDAHNVTSRSFQLTRAYQHVEKKYGFDFVSRLQRNAELMVDGIEFYVDPPIKIESKKSLLQYIKRSFF